MRKHMSSQWLLTSFWACKCGRKCQVKSSPCRPYIRLMRPFTRVQILNQWAPTGTELDIPDRLQQIIIYRLMLLLQPLFEQLRVASPSSRFMYSRSVSNPRSDDNSAHCRVMVEFYLFFIICILLATKSWKLKYTWAGLKCSLANLTNY